MKILLVILILLSFDNAGAQSKEVEEKIYSHRTFVSAPLFLNTVQEIFPEKKLGFFFADHGALHGVLEDFEKERVFYFSSWGLYEDRKITRNGVLQTWPYGEDVFISIAGIEYKAPGEKVDAKDLAQPASLGIWMNLKVTDTLEMKFVGVNEETGNLEVFYHPDTGWRVANRWSKEKIPAKADVYDVTSNSLLAEVKRVLKTKAPCLVRFPSEGQSEMKLVAFDPDKPVGEFRPLRWDLKLKDVDEELFSEIGTYLDGCLAADAKPVVLLEVGPATEELSFRNALRAIRWEDRNILVEFKWVED